jgi:hypothetical protein
VIVTTLLVTPVAQAQTTIDVSKITCEQFVLSNVASPEYIVIWLSGYLSGKKGTTTVDVQRLKDQPHELTTYCVYHGQGVKLMDAVEKMLAIQR